MSQITFKLKSLKLHQERQTFQEFPAYFLGTVKIPKSELLPKLSRETNGLLSNVSHKWAYIAFIEGFRCARSMVECKFLAISVIFAIS